MTFQARKPLVNDRSWGRETSIIISFSFSPLCSRFMVYFRTFSILFGVCMPLVSSLNSSLASSGVTGKDGGDKGKGDMR